jgi:PAS domain-containing protein
VTQCLRGLSKELARLARSANPANLWVSAGRAISRNRLNRSRWKALQSAHHQLETALGRYFDLYQLAPSGCLILDKDGVVLDSSLHPAAIFGWNGWRGRNFRFAMAVEDQTAFNLAHTLLDGSGWPQICEIRLYREQVEFWAQLELLPGQHGLTVVFLVDITARKLAESRLEERQRQMLEFLGEQT